MSRISLILIVSAILFQSRAETIVKDKEHVFGVWNEEGSPYLIEKEAIIPVDKSLKIEAGTTILLNSGIQTDHTIKGNGINIFGFDLGFIRVNGEIEALGEPEKPILFSKYNDSKYWGVVLINDSKKAVFRNCIFQNSGKIKNLDGTSTEANAGLTFINSEGHVQDCTFKNANYGIDLQESSLLLKNSILDSMSLSAIHLKNSTLTISQCSFSNSEGAISPWESVQIDIDQCAFFNNWKDFDERFLMFNGVVTIQNSFFSKPNFPRKIANKAGNTFNQSLSYIISEGDTYHIKDIKNDAVLFNAGSRK